jgi:hypothetical protein
MMESDTNDGDALQTFVYQLLSNGPLSFEQIMAATQSEDLPTAMNVGLSQLLDSWGGLPAISLLFSMHVHSCCRLVVRNAPFSLQWPRCLTCCRAAGGIVNFIARNSNVFDIVDGKVQIYRDTSGNYVSPQWENAPRCV